MIQINSKEDFINFMSEKTFDSFKYLDIIQKAPEPKVDVFQYPDSKEKNWFIRSDMIRNFINKNLKDHKFSSAEKLEMLSYLNLDIRTMITELSHFEDNLDGFIPAIISCLQLNVIEFSKKENDHIVYAVKYDTKDSEYSILLPLFSTAEDAFKYIKDSDKKGDLGYYSVHIYKQQIGSYQDHIDDNLIGVMYFDSQRCITYCHQLDLPWPFEYYGDTVIKVKYLEEKINIPIHIPTGKLLKDTRDGSVYISESFETFDKYSAISDLYDLYDCDYISVFYLDKDWNLKRKIVPIIFLNEYNSSISLKRVSTLIKLYLNSLEDK